MHSTSLSSRLCGIAGLTGALSGIAKGRDLGVAPISTPSLGCPPRMEADNAPFGSVFRYDTIYVPQLLLLLALLP